MPITKKQLTPEVVEATLKQIEDDSKKAVSIVKAHSRRRYIEIHSEAAEQFGCLYAGCRATVPDPSKTEGRFREVIEKLNDDYDERSPNILQPKPREPRKIPALLKDAWGHELPNPWQTGNKRDQDALTVNCPELAKDLKRWAEAPNEFAVSLAREESERQAANAREVAYFESEQIHKKNVFVNPDATESDRTAFAGLAEPEVVRLYQREGKPISIPLFTDENVESIGLGKGKDVTLLGQIFRHDRPLFEVVKVANERYQELNAARFQQEEWERRADAIQAAKQAQAFDELSKGVNRLPDGRVITQGR